jgi:hypothetical protein
MNLVSTFLVWYLIGNHGHTFVLPGIPGPLRREGYDCCFTLPPSAGMGDPSVVETVTIIHSISQSQV